MQKHGWIIFLLAVVVVLMLFYTVAFTANFRQIAIVKTFGKAEKAIYGNTDAGLHWKWPVPVQRVVRYDARMFIFEDTYDDVSTYDNQNILVTVFCGWKITEANKFEKAIEGRAKVEVCERLLRDRVRAAKSNIVGKHPLADFVNTDPKKMRITEIEDEILDNVRQSALRDYGVEIVTLGIKSLGLPKDVTKTVIKSMKAERKREADRYKGTGQAVADAIRERAKTARSQILKFAEAKAMTIRAEGIRAAAGYYSHFERNPEFAKYLREQEFWEKTLGSNSIIVIDAEVLRSAAWLKDGPPRLPVKTNTKKP